MSEIDEAIARAVKFRAERNEVCWTWERGGPSRIARDRDALAAEITTLTARAEHYKRACIATSNEVTRVLGEALYGPNLDAWSTHTPEAIADEAAEEIGRLRAENERMRGEIITYQDAHTTGTEIIDELRAKVEALEAAIHHLQHRPDRCPDCGVEYAALQEETDRLRKFEIDPEKTLILDFYSGGGAYAASIGNADTSTRITSVKASPGTTIRKFGIRAGDVLDALREYAPPTNGVTR